MIKKVCMTSDLHGQEKDECAWDVHLQVVQDFKPDIHVIIGDWMECESVSRHPKSKTKVPNLGYELEIANRDLDALERVLPDGCVKYFLEGNHEFRLQRFLCNETPLLEGGVKTIPEGLYFRERKWKWVPFGKPLKIGHLKIVHGLYTNKYHANKHVESFGDNIIYGDTHTHQVYTTSHGDKPHMAMSCGCLRTLAPDWLNGRPVPWLHGFAVAYILETGEFISYFIPIINGMTIFNGKTYYAKNRRAATLLRKRDQEICQILGSGIPTQRRDKIGRFTCGRNPGPRTRAVSPK